MKFNNYIQLAQEWWQKNKQIVKVGVSCAMAGVAYGFVKGMVASNDVWMDHGYSLALDGIEQVAQIQIVRVDKDCDNSNDVDVAEKE